MLTAELLPLLAARGLRTSAAASLGPSMGGYGTLLLARQSARDALGGPRPLTAAAASPALWTSAGSTAPGAFDDAADWRRWGDLSAAAGVAATAALFVAAPPALRSPRRPGTYRTEVRPSRHLDPPAIPGDHTDGCWRSVAGAPLAFGGTHLASVVR
jgi:hypothetical protein